MRTVHRYTAGVVAAFSTLTLLAACGNQSDPEVVTVGQGAAAGEAAGPSSRVDDTYYPEQIEFLSKFQRDQGEIGPPAPKSVNQAIEYSTVVLLAEVADIIDEGAIDEDGVRDPLTSASIILKPIEVLKGQLQPELDKIAVSFVVPPTIDEPDPIGDLRKTLPVRGQGIWMLRWAATRPSPYGKIADPVEFERTRYVWTHRSTIFAQGAAGVAAPTAPKNSADAPDMSVANRAREYPKLSDLAEAIRSSSSRPQVPSLVTLPILPK